MPIPFHVIASMVILPTEANIDAVSAEASINAAACPKYHQCCCPQKLLPISPFDKAIIIIAASLESYHRCRCHSKLILMSMPAKAIMMLSPTRVTIGVAANKNNHQQQRPTKLSLVSLLAKAIIHILASWSYYWWQCRYPLNVSLMSPLVKVVIVANVQLRHHCHTPLRSYWEFIF